MQVSMAQWIEAQRRHSSIRVEVEVQILLRWKLFFFEWKKCSGNISSGGKVGTQKERVMRRGDKGERELWSTTNFFVMYQFLKKIFF